MWYWMYEGGVVLIRMDWKLGDIVTRERGRKMRDNKLKKSVCWRRTGRGDKEGKGSISDAFAWREEREIRVMHQRC